PRRWPAAPLRDPDTLPAASLYARGSTTRPTRAALAKLASCPHPDFNGKRGTSAPARQVGWQGRAGRGLSRRTGMRRDQPANALLARVGGVAITVSSSTFPRRNVASWPRCPAQTRARKSESPSLELTLHMELLKVMRTHPSHTPPAR